MHRFTASLLQTGLKHARKSNRTIVQVLLAGRQPFAVQTPWGLSCLGVSQRALHTPSSTGSVIESGHDSLEADQKGEQAETVPDPISDTRDKYGLPEHLRPYQVEAIHACMSALDRGETRIGVSSPTGSGKTVMFTNLIPLLRKRSQVSGKKQILILVGAIELARQAMATISSTFPEYLVELEQGSNHASGRADVTVAMYQSMKNDRLNKYDPKRFAAVIVDEAHHSAAPSYVRLLSYFNSEVGAGYKPKQAMDEDLPSVETEITEETSQGLQSEANCPIIGFTATFSRHDEMALSVVFTHIVYHRDVWDMLQDGYLCPVRMTTIKAQMDLSEVNVSSHTGDFNTRALSGKVNTKQFNELIVGTWLDQYKQRKSTLIFCVDLAHVDAMTTMFRESGVDARSVSSHTQERVRKDLIQAFKDGEFPVLINCEILTEGTDIPNIDTVIVARPTKSRNLFSQMIGRGLRNAPGKAYCQIVDVVDNVTNVQGLISIPTLFGLDPMEEEVKDEAIAALKERGEVAQADRRAMEEIEDQMASGDIVYEEDDDPFRLRIHDKRTDNDWRSRLSWVTCGDNKFVLQSVGTNGYFRIIKEGRIYLIQHAMSLPKELSGPGYKSSTPYTTTRTYGRSADLAKAFNIADKLVERIIPRTALPHLYRWASWRKKPASEAQKSLLRKIYPDFETQVADNNVTSPQPRLQGSLIRPTLFNSPMPRLEPQPVKTSMMIQERIRKREHRKDTQAVHWQYMRDMQAEVKFLESLGLEAGKSSKSKLRKGEKSDSLPETDWYMIHQEHLDRIEDSYIREQERASQMVPQAMLDEVSEAKKQRSQARASDKYETMTSGQAASMLTALKHGARAQAKARTKALTREEKKRVKLERQAQKLSAAVKVGEL